MYKRYSLLFPRTGIFFLCIIMLSTTSCGGGVSYTPPTPFGFVTLTIGTDGISVQAAKEFVTEIGTFSVNISTSSSDASSQQADDNSFLLTVRYWKDGSLVDAVYRMNTEGQEVIVTTNGKTIIHVANHRVFIDASNGSIQTIEVRGANATPPDARITPVVFSNPIITYPGPDGTVWDAAFSPDGKQIAFGMDNEVQIWDATNGSNQRTYKTGATYSDIGIDKLAWSPDGKSVASNRGILDVDTGHWQLIQSNGGTAWSPDGKYLAIGEAGQVDIWDTTAGTKSLTYYVHDTGSYAGITALSWSPNGKQVFTAREYGLTEVWDATNREFLSSYHSIFTTLMFAWSPDGKRFAISGTSKGGDGWIEVRDAANGNSIATYRGFSGDVYALAWSPDGKRIAATHHDPPSYTDYSRPPYTIRIWDVASGQTAFIYKLDGWGEALSWSSDGKRITSVNSADPSGAIVAVWTIP